MEIPAVEASGPAWTRLQRIGGEAALFVVDNLVLFGRQEIDIARFPRVTVFRVKFYFVSRNTGQALRDLF